MKVLIFALDGTEYNFIQKWELKNLQQKECGKVTIPRRCYKLITTSRDEHAEPFTPYVWYSFVTGRLPPPPEEFYGRNLLKFLFGFLRNALESSFTFIKKSHVYLFDDIRTFAQGREINLDKKRLRDNIFEYAKRWVTIDFPFISPSWTMKVPLQRGEKFDVDVILNNFFANFQTTRKLTLGKICQNWDLFVIYTKFLDNYGELCFGDQERLRKAYFVVDDFVNEIKSLVEGGFLCLVISDHGIEHFYGPYGKHSNHAFYSVNRTLNLKNPSILDFKETVVQKLKEDN